MSTTSTRVLPSEEPIKDPWNDITICSLIIAMTKVLDDNDIYDNDENNVVGPKKDHGMPTTFPKTEHKKHDIKAKLRLFQKLA